MSRIGRLFRKRREPVDRPGGRPFLGTGWHALGALEAVTCEAIVFAGAARVDEPGLLVRSLPEGTSALAVAGGLAASGLRAAAFVPSDRARGIGVALASLVERRAPVVVHLARDPDRPIDTRELLASGAFVVVPSSLDAAIDVAVVARRLAESSLTPGVVLVDGPEIAWGVQDAELPDPDSLRRVVGDPADAIDGPTPAQRLLFGARRRRVPRWFDPVRPVATGSCLSGEDLEAAQAGRRVFFAEHLAEGARAARQALVSEAGREVPPVTGHHLDGARHVLVAQGAAVERAVAVARHLRESERLAIGVLDWTWLRPRPDDEIARALRDADEVTVLEPAAEPVLATELRAIPGLRPRVRVGDVYRTPASGTGTGRADPRVGVPETGVRYTSPREFPRLEALEARVRRAYPDTDGARPGRGEPPDLRPGGARSVALLLRRARVPDVEAELAVERLSPAVGRRARGRTIRRRPGVWQIDLTLSREKLLAPGSGTPADVVVVDGVERLEEAGPPIATAAGAALVVGSTRGAAALWADMPRAWRDLVRRAKLRLVRVAGDLPAQLDAACRILARAEHGADEVGWKTLADPAEVDRVLPLAVRRFDASGTTYDNVSRFWGEYAQPLDGGVRPAGLDPYLALGAMPVCSSTFRDRTPRRERHPSLDPALCTGCGLCWTSCPDSAIAPVALGVETLLGAAAPGAADDPAAAKLRRAHRQLASRVAREIEQSGARRWTDEPLRAAYDAVRPKLPVGEDEAPAVDAAFEATRAALAAMPLAIPDVFFGEAGRERKGAGELLLLGFNPQACQACGICAAVCPDEAIRIVPQTPHTLDAMRASWEAWERLPDTDGKSIDRAMRHPRIGPVAGLLLSRHCLYTVAGGDHAEPGSGERIAVRQVAAVVEFRMQQRALERIARLDRLAARLHDGVREELARAVAVDDLDRLARDLSAAPRGIAEVVARFEATPGATSVDRPRLEALVAAGRAVDALRADVSAGALGIGRSRFGLVLAGSVADWAAHFPRNPFSVPVTVDLDAHGADTAIGLLEGLRARAVDETRTVRRAELLLDRAADAEADLARLSAADLTDEELAAAPALLVVARAGDPGATDFAGLSRLLTSGLPVRVILLDRRELGGDADPGLVALAHREAFVLSASISEPRHLFDGLVAALDFDGPALVHVHAPVPQRDGFSTERTVERARLAVAARVHPLFRYDPGRPGAFGLRLDLDGNPSPESRWGRLGDAELTPAHWAAREERFAGELAVAGTGGVPVERWYDLPPAERRSAIPTVPGPDGASLAVGGALRDAVVRAAERWATLQELAGLVTPFVDSVRSAIVSELAAGHEAEIGALRAEHEARIAEMERSGLDRQMARLRERLLDLAGYGRGTRA